MARPKRKQTSPINQDEAARKAMAEFEQVMLANQHYLNTRTLKSLLAKLPVDKQEYAAGLLARMKEVQIQNSCRLNFMEFARYMWPSVFDGTELHEGRHFHELAKAFHRIDSGEPVRLIINIAPRRSKSRFGSVLFPGWFFGKHPEKQVIQISNIASLAEGFGANVRDMIQSPEYQAIFPGTKLRKDSKAKGEWTTMSGGKYYAAGVGGKIMGKGADVLIIDDPHSEQNLVTSGEVDQLPSKTSFETAYNWFTSILTRVERSGSILIIMQRLTSFDLTGRLIDAMKTKQTSDKWEVISIPALEAETDSTGKEIIGSDGLPVMRSSWDFYSTEAVLKLKASMPAWKWESQFQQNPSHDHAATIKRDYWKWWGRNADGTIDEAKNQRTPDCSYVIQSWDTAGTANTRSNYSACTTWGVFKAHTADDGSPVYNIFLIHAMRGKWEYPDLKRKIIEQYQEFRPDTVLVEKTSAGLAVVTDLPRSGVPIRPYIPKGNQFGLRGDKQTRVDAVADIFYSGMVWVPLRAWARDVVEEFAMFGTPGSNDDYVDSTTQAIMRFREGGFISLPLDKRIEDEEDTSSIQRSYY